MNKMKILVVEDEAIVAFDIKRALIKLGFYVTNTVTNYYDALSSVIEEEPDIIIMDINLKDSKDGIETANDIKNIKNIDIIYLTAFCDENTLKRASQTNPVGYLIKPFKREELKSTIFLAIYKKENIHKRIDVASRNIILIGENNYFDRDFDELYFKEEKIKLSTKELSLLKILVEAKGNIVPFSILENFVWQGEMVSKGALRTLLYRLRTKLDHKFIESYPTMGVKINITL